MATRSAKRLVIESRVPLVVGDTHIWERKMTIGKYGWAIIGAAFIAGLIFVFPIRAVPGDQALVPGHLTAKSLTLFDDLGTPRMLLQAAPDGPRIRFYGKRGNIICDVVESNGGVAAYTFDPTDATPRFSIGIQSDSGAIGLYSKVQAMDKPSAISIRFDQQTSELVVSASGGKCERRFSICDP